MPDGAPASTRLPLRFSLPLVVFGAFLLLTVITLVLSHRSYHEELMRNTEIRARIQSARMASLAEAHLLATPQDIQREIGMLRTRGDIDTVVIADPEHRVLLAHRPEWAGQAFAAVLPAVDTRRIGTTLQLHWDAAGRRLDILMPFSIPSIPAGTGQRQGLIYIGVDIGQQISNSFRANFQNHFAILGAGLILALALYFWLRRTFVRPLETLLQAARRIGSGNLASEIRLAAAPELNALAAELNAMEHNLRANQEMMKAKEEGLRLLGDNLPDSYVYQVLRTPEGKSRFVYLSSGVERIHLVSAADIMADASRLYEQIFPEDTAAVAAAERISQTQMTDFVQTVRVRRPDGQTRWLQVRSHPSRRKDGSVVWDGVTTDISLQKQAETDLQNALTASERFRAALDHVNAYVFMKDRESRYFYANRMTLDLFGCTAVELFGAPDERFFPPETVKREREIDLRVLAGENTSEEIEVIAADGTRRIYWEVKSPIHVGHTDADREVWGISGISTDITAHKELEESLTYLTRRGQIMLELPKLAEAHDEPGFMRHGLELAEELTESRISFIHYVNEDEEAIELVSQKDIWAEALRQKQPVVFNDYASTPDKRGLPSGHTALERLTSLPVIEQGKVVMLAGVGNKLHDYTARDVETLQLIANEIWRLVQRGRSLRKIERFNLLIEHSHNEIYTFDAESLRFVDVNRGARANIGYSLEELRTMTPLDIKSRMSREEFLKLLEPLRSGEQKIIQFATVHRRKDGTEYDVEIHLELTEDINPLFVAVARDVTARLKAEADLRQALRVVEASPVVSFRWLARDGWPVDYVSQNVSRWGYRPEDIRAGRPAYTEIIHPDDLSRVTNEVTLHTIAGSTGYMQSYRIRAADGRYFWVEDNTRVIRDKSGAIVAYEGVVTDVDVQKRYEQELATNLAEQKALNKQLEAAQSQLLQSEKMASIGQLAAGVAHELNNPIGFVNSNMGTLDGYLHDIFAITDAYSTVESLAPACCPELDKVRALKREKDYDFLRADIFQLMTESKDGLARVAKIVKDLKDFSRAGETAMQWANLHQGIDSTLNIVWNELKYKCTVTKQYGELPQVWCEPSQLNQVFMNLLVNASHAIPDKGEITITTGCQGDEVYIAISDTGTGIAPDNLSRIFDPFFTTKPVGKGTGLGLSLAYSIVQKHHGRIEVRSELGKGTTFTVWLPIQPPGGQPANNG